MDRIRWILIDEAQDFSPMFHQLVVALRQYNPQVHLFCVGDDWQAINGFAGSDLDYFDNFKDWVGDAKVVELLTNFRSNEKIVSLGNALMKGIGKGKPARHLAEKIGGHIQIWKIKSGFGTYLDCCYKIITDGKNRGKNVAILSRTNQIGSMSLTDFHKNLLSRFTDNDKKKLGNLDQKVEVTTVHGYKGLQADMIIIAGANDDLFPLIHPDNVLYGILGKTLADTIEEERRLFYVALTRAKSSLFILTEQGRESVFLEGLPKNLYDSKTYIPEIEDGESIPF